MSHGGDLVTDILHRYEVRQVFGQPGGQTAALYAGLSKRGGEISHLGCRDERSAAYAADAYARVTGRPGVCDVTVGPGTTKLPDGLVESMNASVPIVALVGDLPRGWVPLRDGGVGAQGFDQLPFLQSITKGSWVAPDLETVPDLLRLAFRTATSGRPGPVAVIIPHDVLDAEWDGTGDFETDARYVSAPAFRPRPPDEELRKAAQVIAASRRPLIVAGGGVLDSRATRQLDDLVLLTDSVVATSFTGKGSVDETADHSVGVLNPLGPRAARQVAAEADLIIWLGSKVGQNTSLNWTLPKVSQMTVQVDIQPSEIGRTFGPTVGLQGDVRETLIALLPLIQKRSRSGWRARALELKRSAWEQTMPLRESESAPVAPPRVMSELSRRLSADDIVISDASFSAGWTATYIRAQVPGRNFLFARGQGSLGYSVPASMGAALARPGSRVVTVSGDGGFSYAIGELATQAQHGMKTLHVVLNNGAWGWLKMWQHLHYEGLRYSVDLESQNTSPDYAAAASALGCTGIRVDKPSELSAAFDEAFAAEGPAVVEVRIDPEATPIDSYTDRLRSGKFYPRPGTVYRQREWRNSATA